MEKLWKKEEYQSQLVFVDLFAYFLGDTSPISDQPKESPPLDLSQKNSQRSTELRNSGNECFLAGNAFDAIRFYNQSLCFAEIGSENIPQAYINRSACFFRLKMHDKAFRDIQLAKKANLPDRMRSKVERLEKDCQKVMNCIEKRANHLPKLSYEADNNYSCMANVLDIGRNDIFGRHLSANCDIPVGKIVLLEECFIACAEIGHDMCYTCYRQMGNFIPCTKCPDVLFCSEDCLERNTIHKWECCTPSIANNIKTKLTIDAIVLAIETFSGVDNLMSFVDKVLCDDIDKLPSSVHDAESKFHFYFKLTKTAMFHDQMIFDVYEVYNDVLAVRKIADLFDSEVKRRFLIHLIAHIYFVNHANSIGSETIRRVINVFSIINHSCAPNLYTCYAGKVHHCITIRPVKKGEQLFINYLGTQKQAFNERQTELKSKWNFLCGCDKCKPDSESIDREKLITDPTYTFITENGKEMAKPFIILEECENFLNNYAHSTWSKEMEDVSEIYKSALILEHLKNTL